MSSPNLNDVIIAGCIFYYLTVILLGIDTRVLNDNQLQVMCQVMYNRWTISSHMEGENEWSFDKKLIKNRNLLT